MDAQSRHQFTGQLYEQFARIPKALANGHRLELLELLAQSERSVEGLARESGMSVANTSQHLQTLHAAKLVDMRRVGTSIRYRLADEQVFRVWQAIRDLGASRLAEIDHLVNDMLIELQSSAPIESAEWAIPGSIHVDAYAEMFKAHSPLLVDDLTVFKPGLHD